MKSKLFGNLSQERGKDRLFTIGVAVGVIFGTVLPFHKPAAVLIALFVIVVRTSAQYCWPDRDSGEA